MKHTGSAPYLQGCFARGPFGLPRTPPGRGAEFDREWLRGWDDTDEVKKQTTGAKVIEVKE